MEFNVTVNGLGELWMFLGDKATWSNWWKLEAAEARDLAAQLLTAAEELEPRAAAELPDKPFTDSYTQQQHDLQDGRY